MPVERPAGVTAVAAVFFGSGAYLLVVGLTMLARPGLVSMAAGAVARRAGTRRSLHVSAGWRLAWAIALGLWRLHRWARWLAILVAMIGVVMLLPSVSSAMLDFRIGRLAWAGWERSCG